MNARELIRLLAGDLDHRRHSIDILRQPTNRVLPDVKYGVHAARNDKSAIAPAPHNGSRLDEIAG
jgi:hypothetical protein